MYAFFDVFTGSAFRGNSRVSVVYPNKRSETRRVDDVIADLKPHRRLEAVAACIRTYGTSRDRMRCDLCRKRGLPVGAGVVKAPASRSSGADSKEPAAAGLRREPTPCSPSNALQEQPLARLPRLEGLQRRSRLTEKSETHPGRK